MKKFASVLYVLFTGALIGLRCFIQNTLLEPDTGFYLENALPITIQNWALLAVCLLWLVFPFLVFNSRQEPLKHQGPSGLAQIFLGFVLLLSVVLEALFTNSSSALFTLTMLPQMLLWLLGTACGVLFLIHGFGILRGKEFRSTAALFSYLIPVVWMVAVLIYHFVRYTAALTISYQLFEILFYLAATIFFLGHAGVLCDVCLEKSLRYSMIGGCIGSLFAFLLTVPTGIAYLMGNTDKIFCSVSQFILFLGLGLYQLFYVLYCLIKSQPRQRRLREELAAPVPEPADPQKGLMELSLPSQEESAQEPDAQE